MTINFTAKPLSKKFRVILLTFLTNAVILGTSAFAQTEVTTVAELRAQIESLSARLEQLEAETPISTRKMFNSWVNNIKVSGDLRSRYENIDDSTAGKVRFGRNRIRARLDISAEVNEDWNMSFGLASGSDDPISTNQSLGGGSTSKSLVLDYAYFVYNGIDNFSLTGGKYRNVFYRVGDNAMLFDADFRPEGIAFRYSRNDFFVNAGTMILKSDNGSPFWQDEETMWGAQAGYRLGALTFGVGYFDASVKDSQPFYDNDCFGNSCGSHLPNLKFYLYNYEQVELFAEYDFSLEGLDISIFADFVQNQDAKNEDKGWVLGTTFGTGPLELGYSFQDLEADAVFGTFTDSDYGGGGTGAEGHIFTGEYSIAPSTNVGFTYFMNEIGIANTDYDRLQVDLAVSF